MEVLTRMDNFIDKHIFSRTGRFIGRAPLTKHGLPIYSQNEEIFNATSHFLGIPLGIVIMISTINNYHSTSGLLSGLFFGLSTLMVYSGSCIYHSINPKNHVFKKFFQAVDRAAIFILIAGTCSPFVFFSIQNNNSSYEWLYYGFLWLCAFSGVALLFINIEKYKYLSVIMYIVMSISSFYFLLSITKNISTDGNILFLIGLGVFIVGFLFYGLGSKIPWMHSVFHIFCLIGSILHSYCVLNYLI